MGQQLVIILLCFVATLGVIALQLQTSPMLGAVTSPQYNLYCLLSLVKSFAGLCNTFEEDQSLLEWSTLRCSTLLPVSWPRLKILH
jgi:hypothetical protein